MIKKKLLVFSIVFFSITLNSFSTEPDVFVQSTVNRASKLLGEDITKNEKIEKLKLIAKETVDIRGIGFYTLGKKRKSLNEQEQKKYAELFE
jgi:phospholipid transport system substrate-binding protein